jgi:hypothetical protein
MRIAAILSTALPLVACCLISSVVDVNVPRSNRATGLTVAAVFCAIAVVLAVGLLIGAQQRVDRRGRGAAFRSFFLVGLAVGSYFLWSAVEKVKKAEERIADANNLHQLAIAMHEYEKKHGHLPPAAIFSADGKPLLSWRVLLLPHLEPHLEQKGLYHKFHLDEPWDSPHNYGLLKEMPGIFGDPWDKATDKDGTTRYRVLSGPGAAFEGKTGIPLSDFTDGTDQTILVVAGADAIPWTKPEELIYDPTGALPKFYYHNDTTQAVLVNGHVEVFDHAMSEKTLRALITRKAGDKPGDDR